MQTVINLSGKAKVVFAFMALLSKFQGNKTLGDLSK